MERIGKSCGKTRADCGDSGRSGQAEWLAQGGGEFEIVLPGREAAR